ncbi:MAG: hypothetical protein GY953_56575, partial [bacterium]|nr:hypothetical protein [bacterium]
MRSFSLAIPMTVTLLSLGGSFLRGQTVTEAVLEDFTDMVTAADQDVNDFGGNIGVVNKDGVPYGHTFVVTNGPTSQMVLTWDFGFGVDPNPFTGVFFSLFGRTDTQTTQDGQTVETVRYPEHSLDLDRVDGALSEPGGDRRYLGLVIRVRNDNSADVVMKLELTDTSGGGRVTNIRLRGGGGVRLIIWDFRNPAQFDVLGHDLDIHNAKLLTVVVERRSGLAAVRNPDRGSLTIDSISFIPDRPQPEPAGADDLLDLLERRALQYFLDWSSRKPESLGLPQDRSTFPDLLTTGGIGFALPAFAIATERGYLDRAEAADRTVAILRILGDRSAFCPDPVGCIGYKGWFYHFLGLDARRKQNLDNRNTVELSSIDT